RRVWLLLGLGLLVGVGRLAGAALFQPAPEALAVLRQAALPWLLIHPAGILLLGWLLAESQQEIYARRRIDTVNELTTSATAQLDLPQVLDIALDRTLKIMGVQMGWIRVLSEERGGFVLEIQQGLSPRYVREREVVSFEGNVLVAEAAREMRPIAIPDITADPRASDTMRAEGVVFLAVVPLSARGKLVGVMTLASRARRQLLPEEEQLLMTIANVIGVALENARLYGELERMATTDELTGLYNRREIERLLAEEVNRALRVRLPLSVIMADLDHFTRVNDTYGHHAGDRALQHVAALLKTRFRGIDLPGRYGGEELLLVLPGTDKGAAIGVAEKLRELLETTPFQVDGRELRVTLSAGVATLPADARMGDRLIQRADQALYEAKQTGRNRVCAA
ncbi:MAG: sensor domain-containing diguanylate cyclase, partial [Deltaproteobacteria bacterium]|nr:sensor domain-containing diguanylate cyclase [Deltaproteobacteria bacterium]